MSDLFTYAAQQEESRTPFDNVMRTDEHGNEFWSARDLLPLMGYTQWKNFETPLNRAMSAARNQGHDVAANFSGYQKVTVPGKMPQIDYSLSRFGCYLVAMNGDPNKPEVAAAQSYFAIQTRVAEVQAAPVKPSGAELLAMAVIEAQAMIAAKDQHIAQLEPKADYADMVNQSAGLRTLQDLTNDLKQYAAANHPGVKVYQEDVYDLAGELGLIKRHDSVSKNQPTGRAIEAGWVKRAETTYEKKSGEKVTKYFARLTPRGTARVWETAVRRLRDGQPIFDRKAAA